MPTSPVPTGRRFKREELQKGASFVANLGRREKRIPCVILDGSPHGFRIGWTFELQRGQAVGVILDENPLNVVRCSVVWVGKAGSKQEGEVGLQTV